VERAVPPGRLCAGGRGETPDSGIGATGRTPDSEGRSALCRGRARL